MTNETNLRDLSIAELKDRREQMQGTPAGTSHIDEEIEERRRQREKEAELLDLKVKLEEARRSGLSDDLTIQRIEDQIADLASDLETGPRAELARETGVDRSIVAELSADEAEEALSHLEAIEHIEGASQHSILSEKSAEDNRAALESVLEDHEATAATLEERYLSDETGDGLAAALLEDSNEDDTLERANLSSSRDDGPTPQEELASETGLSEEQADQFSDRKARRAVDLYTDLDVLAGLPHEKAQDMYDEKAEKLAELVADVDADKAALGLNSDEA